MPSYQEGVDINQSGLRNEGQRERDELGVYEYPDINQPLVAPSYVYQLREELFKQFEGFRLRIDEIERLKNFEDPIYLTEDERKAGLDVRTGLTADLIEQVKSAVTTNKPLVQGKPLREGQKAQDNSSKRELFWQRFLWRKNRPAPQLSELADAQFGLGLGILKAAYVPWPAAEREKKKGEAQRDYLDRTKALRKLWGPPFKLVTVHPLSFVFLSGEANEPSEVIEESLKPKRTMLRKYHMEQMDELGGRLSMTSGNPTERAQALPQGISTDVMVKTTEYWAKDNVYQVYLDDRLVYQTDEVWVKYLLTFGRTSSSKDPDKLGLGVAEAMRHIEPLINRSATRMVEAADLLVRKRLAIELPEGSLPDTPSVGADNNPTNDEYIFTPEKSRVLPPGAQIKDPFAGVEHVYQAMPLLNLLLQMAGQHGIAPIFKGMPPGAAGSGYRDNSLYMMARSQFQYMVYNFEECLAELIRWFEYCLVTYVQQTVYLDDLELDPSDVEDFPLEWHVTIEPYLPQNVIAEGQFYAQLAEKGHIPERLFLEEGLKKNQPDELMYELMLEDLQNSLKPALYMDVLTTVGAGPKSPSSLVGPNGQPITANPNAAVNPVNPMSPAITRSPGGTQQALSSMSRGGTAGRGQMQPPNEPGSFPPGMED